MVDSGGSFFARQWLSSTTHFVVLDTARQPLPLSLACQTRLQTLSVENDPSSQVVFCDQSWGLESSD